MGQCHNCFVRYRTIQPRSTTTFYLSNSIYWSWKDNGDFKSEISILQKKQKQKFTRRTDELHLSFETIDPSKQSVQALKREYRTIKDLYYQKIDADGKSVSQILKYTPKSDDKKREIEAEIRAKDKQKIENKKSIY